ncbi:MAG TPA: DUF58 domain-containing protein [Rhodocyclaceae bacterium]|nr:DUF58 domain-containing protein [Rhodocyclaceae bacterium]
MKLSLRQWRSWGLWWLRQRTADTPPLILTQRRIYVLPTKAGLAYAATLIVLLVASINYNLSLGYALTFLLAGLGIVAIVHAFRNLSGLRLSPASATSGFAGRHIQFSVTLGTERPRPAVYLAFDAGEGTHVDLGDNATVNISMRAAQRGWQAMPRLTIATTWPLGLIRAWSYARFNTHCLVYPAPADMPSLLPLGEGTGRRMHNDPEDFFGLRPHRTSDLLQHVAWKASARLDGGLLSKQFAAEHGDVLWFDIARAQGTTVDEKLAVLTRWSLDAHAAGHSFGLRLGSTEIAPASDAAHLHACLKALALHE